MQVNKETTDEVLLLWRSRVFLHLGVAHFELRSLYEDSQGRSVMLLGLLNRERADQLGTSDKGIPSSVVSRRKVIGLVRLRA